MRKILRFFDNTENIGRRTVSEPATLLFSADVVADKMWKATERVMEDPSVPAFAALQAVSSWRNTSWWRNEAPVDEGGAPQFDMEALVRTSKQRSRLGYGSVELSGR